jgi:hypothetical protein
VPAISNALSSAFRLEFCHDVQAAEALLDFPFDAILCGTSFDSSRMLDMLRIATNHHLSKRVPFIVIKATPSKLPESTFEALKKIALLMGAADFIEYFRYREALGEESANIQLREQIALRIAQAEARNYKPR